MYKKHKKGSKKGTIILLHGNSSSSQVFESVFDSNIPHSIIAYDLPGHGQSEHNGKYSIDELKEQLLQEIQKVKDDLLLVGNSLGGHLFLEILADVPYAKGMMIFGTPPVKYPLNMEEAFLPNPDIGNYFTASPEKEEIKRMFEDTLCGQAMVADFENDFYKADPKVRTALAMDIESGNAFIDEHVALKSFGGKKTILHGIHDPSVSPDYLKKEAKDMGAELIILDDCGHFISAEQPALFIKHLSKFASASFDN